MPWKAIVDWPNGSSTLNANINSVVTSIVLASDPGSAMSTSNFWVRIGYEQIYVTSRSTVTLTCTGGRGANGTTAAAHFAGDAVVQDFFAAHIAEIRTAIDAINPLIQATLAVGGGYGDTGCTISATGNISTNGTLTVDGVSTLTGVVTLGAASIVTPATFAFGAAATALTIGAATGTCTIANATLALSGASLTTPTTFTLGAAATTLNFGAATGTCTINNATLAAKSITLSAATGNSLIVDTTTFVVDASNNRIGIRTATPGVPLQVNAPDPLQPALGTAGGHFALLSAAGSYGLYVGITYLGNAWLQVQSNSAATAYNLILQEKGGKVGVGFAAPLAKLCVDGGLHVGGASDPGDNNLTVDGTATITGIVTLGGASMTLPATFTLGSAACTTLNLGTLGATMISMGAATGTMTVNNTTLAAKAGTFSTTLAVTGVVTATAAANVINIGSSCTMTIPPIIGGTTPNIGYFSVLSASTNLYSTNGVLVLGSSGVARGSPVIYHGADGSTAGYIKIYSRNGTAHYIWVEDDMTLKISSAVPVLNADGSVVGAQT